MLQISNLLLICFLSRWCIFIYCFFFFFTGKVWPNSFLRFFIVSDVLYIQIAKVFRGSFNKYVTEKLSILIIHPSTEAHSISWNAITHNSSLCRWAATRNGRTHFVMSKRPLVTLQLVLWSDFTLTVKKYKPQWEHIHRLIISLSTDGQE